MEIPSSLGTQSSFFIVGSKSRHMVQGRPLLST